LQESNVARTQNNSAKAPAADLESLSLESLSFEQILEKLSGVVEALEEGEIPLEQALLTFEQGIALSRVGARRLDEAERRIEVLLRPENNEDRVQTRPLTVESDDDE
jgi:exodeoxyribonuclease VII small subunit